MKSKYKKIVIVVIIITIGIFITILSNQKGVTSHNLSYQYSLKIATILEKIGELHLSEEHHIQLANWLYQPTRKLAHLVEYAIMAGVVFIGMAIFYPKIKEKRIKRIIITFFILFLFASADEIHQRFIPERSGKVQDIGWDMIGALVGIIVINFFSDIAIELKQKKDNKRQKSKNKSREE